MRLLRGLLVDDQEKSARTIEQSLDFAFQGLGLQVDWTLCASAYEARTAIRVSPVFDFAVIDLYLEENEPDGLAVVEALRRVDARPFVLVVTGQPDRNAAFRDDAEEVGATHAIPRALLFRTTGRWSPASVAKLIQDHLSSTGLIPVATVAYDDEPGIRSLLEAVGGGPGSASVLTTGEAIVRNLAARCLGERVVSGASLRLSYLVPGRSGAHVCRIDVSSPGQPRESFVLKIGLDRVALERERRANAEASRVLSQQTLISIIGDVHVDQSGYAAIVAKVADAAIPLARWLDEQASSHDARAVARVLFREQLRGLTQPELRKHVPIVDWTKSSALYQARVHAMLARFRDAAGHPEAGNRRDVERLWTVISDFVRHGVIPTRRAGVLQGSAQFAGGFGDLHSSNVLVPIGLLPRPVLIDASMYGLDHHWALDFARLLVDVFLRVRQPGVPAMLWSSFRTDLEASGWLCPLRRSTAADTSTATAFLDQICEEVAIRQPEYPGLDLRDWHWQWHVAVAKEFLRQSSSSDLTPMRAALALVAAGRHLRDAAVIIDVTD